MTTPFFSPSIFLAINPLPDSSRLHSLVAAVLIVEPVIIEPSIVPLNVPSNAVSLPSFVTLKGALAKYALPK
ncbi:hypothetical protein D3C75_1185360 [compost metagenome]